MKKMSAVFDGLKLADNALAYGIKMAETWKPMPSRIFPESFPYKTYMLDDLFDAQVKLKCLLERDKQTWQNSVGNLNTSLLVAHN